MQDVTTRTICMNFLRETYSFQFSRVHILFEIHRFWRLHGNPRWHRDSSLAHRLRRVWLLKFAEDSGWNYYLAERARQNCFGVAQNEGVQR